jgi:signal transduction histidine kinase
MASLASVAFFVLAGALPLRHHTVLILALGAAYVYVIYLAGKRLGPLYGVPLAVAGGLAFDSFYIPPTQPFGASDWQNWLAMAIYISTAVLVGMLGARSVRRAEVSEEARGVLADEHAALRRVATLVAQGAPSSQLFAAVAREVGEFLAVDLATVTRYESDDSMISIATWVAAGKQIAAGRRWPLGPSDLGTTIARTGRPARIENYQDRPGRIAAFVREELGVGSSVGSPIVVEGRLWGMLVVHSTDKQPLPANTEARLTNFTELVATAIANAQVRTEVGRLADEQAALRRVATLVARESLAAEVFAAVAEEVGLLLDVDDTRMYRYEDDGTATVVANWGEPSSAVPPIGARLALDGDSVPSLVYRTERSARVGDYMTATGEIADVARRLGLQSAVGAPIVVDGRVWGVMVAASTQTEPLPADTESRIEEFTELVATAISNIQARSDLAASRARVIATADEERRRVVRDLHDGAQQRLVHTILTLKMAHRALEQDVESAPAYLTDALDQAEAAMVELRELAHGILPSVLTWGGLPAGVEALASRTPVPVEIDVSVGRFPPAIEASAYFVVAEALTNVAKHSQAKHAAVMARVTDGTLEIEIEDDGIGEADPTGHGMLGMADRLASLDGVLRVISVPAQGTKVIATLPLPEAPGG